MLLSSMMSLIFGKQIIGDSDIDDQLLAVLPLIYTINQRDVVSSVAITM